MSYRLTYRGEFDNVLATKDAVNSPITQTVRIDINDTSTGSDTAAPVNGAVTMGASSYGVLVVANGGGASTYAELVAFFTGGNGMAIRITGSNSDGDFIITSDPVFTPPTSLPTFGYVNFNINVANLAGTIGVNSVQFEDISVAAVIPLQMTGDPLKISVIDNNEDKFTPIRGKQAEIKIYTGGGIDINTFCEGDDGRWYVEIFVDTLIVFRGFLIVPDMQQDFQPDPNVLILTATDNLGTLKDIPLVDADGNTPQDQNRIIDYLWWAIRKTGIIQPMNIINNLIPDTGSADHFYNQCFLDARTFEDQIGTCINCYEVLARILGEDCVLFQSKGEWWIVRVDEIEDYLGTFQYDVAVFDPEFQSISTRALTKAIGISETMWWCNDDTIVIPDRPYQRVRETFKYEYPQEIICNIDFSRGDFIADLPDETIDGVANQVKSFDPECWTYIKGYPELTQDSDGYIKKYYVNGQEKQRFLFSDTAVTDAYYYWRSDVKVRMEANSKFNFNLDVKYSTDPGGGSGHFDIAQAQIRLYGDDGSHWTLHADYGTGSSDPGPRWVLSDGSWATNNNYVRLSGDASSTDFTQWNNVSGDTAPLPVSGLVEFFLMNNQTSDSQTKSFFNLKIDYFPFINGSYQKYSGQYNQVSQELGNRAARDEQIYISDSPAQLIKGSLLYFDGTGYVLASLFNDHNHATSEIYGKIQVFSVWNQYRESARNFEGNVDFIDTDISIGGQYDGADLIHKYDLTDSNGSTNNRYFMALHYEQDFYLLTWKAFLASVQKNKVYTDSFEFKYITS